MASPAVTVVVVPRERFSHAERSLESIYRNTDYPFDLIYVDGRSPDPVRQYLQRASTAHKFRLVRYDEFLSPNRARNIGLALVNPSTTYVVFIDNDAEVERGWLTELVACAEDTGAWAVSPVYLEGVPRDQRIHMAGGYAEITERAGLRSFAEDHLHNWEHYPEVRRSLKRDSTGFFEFHCVLLRLSALEQLGALDEELLSNHEHLDLSLAIRQAGGMICLAPEARITYVHGLLDDYDLQYALLRWSDDWNRRSTLRFADKWRLNGDPAWVDESVEWGRRHLEHLKRSRRSARTILKHHAATNILTRRAYAMLRSVFQ